MGIPKILQVSGYLETWNDKNRAISRIMFIYSKETFADSHPNFISMVYVCRPNLLYNHRRSVNVIYWNTEDEMSPPYLAPFALENDPETIDLQFFERAYLLMTADCDLN